MGFRWNSPLTQVLAVGVICFCCPGMFNALNSLGGGGQVDSDVGQNANVALYTCFTIFGLLSGAIHNKLGPKWTIFIGCTCYMLYVGSFLCYNRTKAGAFTITAGGILGIGAGMLWTAQGAMMMAYPREQEKGKFIGYFWAIFNMGAVLGSVLAFGINFHTTERKPLGDTTYAVFLAIMGVGTITALSLAPPSSVTHSNGDRILIQKFPTWAGEIKEILKLFLNWRMIVLIPMFLSSNWFYPYQFSTVNGSYFTIRTQSLNNILYWASQIGGSYSFARVLDFQGVNRRTRALWGLTIISCCFVATWVGGIFFQHTYTKDTPNLNHDFKEGASYVGPLFLYMFYGLNDAAWQTFIYWLMGAMSNDATILSRYAGFYKCVQSCGAAISWRINAVKTPYMTELIICFALLGASVPGALYLALRIKDHSDSDTDLDMGASSDKQEIEA
ncbi:MAG: major facilitator superfamily domain-containing protein [Benniella sp.]|nr:MAG: major facilitator superfamily domain-containing protein [Benniella sp.]KAK3817208.1 MAG: major facilitator superfamily domain-containing protein [Benniella sp.]